MWQTIWRLLSRPGMAVEIQETSSHLSIVQARSLEQAWRIANKQLADGEADHNKHSWQENSTHALRKLEQENNFYHAAKRVTVVTKP